MKNARTIILPSKTEVDVFFRNERSIIGSACVMPNRDFLKKSSVLGDGSVAERECREGAA
jgi:hypothetical protein